jgi:hypothetical protein
MPSLFVIIPGYGAPHANIKEQILRYNLQHILAYKWSDIKITICAYDETPLPHDITDLPCVNVVREAGLPGDFLMRHATPASTAKYDYVLILYDDILLQPNVDFARIMEIKEFFNLNIISPSLTQDSQHVYKYMLTSPDSPYEFKITPVCELFCYFMDHASFATYYEHLDDKNPWLWGLDLILHRHIKLKVGIMNTMTMKHFFQGTAYAYHPDRPPTDGYNHTLKKYNEESDFAWRDQPAAFYYIVKQP